MAKAELKTKATELGVADYIAALSEPVRRADAAAIDALYRRVIGLEPKMWGPSIIGYGSYHYKYDSGRGGTMCRAGFSPRKGAQVLYVMGGLAESAPLGGGKAATSLSGISYTAFTRTEIIILRSRFIIFPAAEICCALSPSSAIF